MLRRIPEREESKMEGLSKTFSCLFISVIVTITILCTEIECRSPVLHRVGGGKYTWEPNVNITEWASHQHFYVGDWLYFGFDKHKYNVLQVNKTNYEKCSDKDIIENVTRGGRDVFNLTETETYYFICSRGDCCFRGLKVAVFVETDLPPPNLSPNLIISASSLQSNTFAQFMLVYASALLCIFCFGCI